MLLIFNRTKVKNPPLNKPFIYNTKIIVNGNITKDEKKRLTVDLDNYWDDSLKVAKLQKAYFFYTIKDPAVFDSNNIIRTKRIMNAYLNSKGYYYASFKDSVPKFDTLKGSLGLWNLILNSHKTLSNQIRASVIMTINTGKSITINSIAYDLVDSLHNSPKDTVLQELTLQNKHASLLKNGLPYTKEIISNELDRLVNLYRQNGYYKFTRDNIYALVDTTDQKLLTITFDPFEQAKLVLEAAKNRRENPQWNISLKQRANNDSLKLNRFYINKIHYYPETGLTDISDSLIYQNNFKKQYPRTNKNSILYYTEGKFKIKPLLEHTTLIKHDSLYNESRYFKSINALSQIGAWQQVDGKVVTTAKDSLDLYFFLVPAPKQNFTVNLETSINTGGDIATGSNLYGLSTNFSYLNRNIWKQAAQSLTSLRAGIEINTQKIKADTGRSFQLSLSQSYSFPKFIVPISRWAYLNKFENKQTIITANASYTDRKYYYLLRNLSANLGYQGVKDNILVLFKPLNVELYKVDTLDGLINLFRDNPFLRNSFRDGNVVGANLSLSRVFNRKLDNKQQPRESHFVRLALEESGILFPFINLGNKVFDYVKLESDYRFVHKYRKSELASRFYIGTIIPKAGESTPIVKQFFLGGPNSMRAWGMRQLGLGSSITSDTSTSGYTDRYGDFAMEGNLEYRFNIWDFGFVKIGSAFYTDIGNLWSIRKDPANVNGEISLPRFGKDLAIGVGTGLRFDLSSYLIIRLDFAYKVKDPARQSNNGWMSLKNFNWTDIRQNGQQIQNCAFQFGIGLPF